ncbi:translation initiation factor IF-2 [Oryctolagus cuniculus]|uniref:translation initiation factor IF-2 n=1 Tax=Oryctolagus cuniculus TaxID=9986 RepID=UPI00387A0409
MPLRPSGTRRGVPTAQTTQRPSWDFTSGGWTPSPGGGTRTPARGARARPRLRGGHGGAVGAGQTRRGAGGGGVSRAKLSVAGRRGLPCRGGPVSPAARLGAAPARSRGVAAVVVAAAAGLRGGGGPTAAAAPGPHKEQTARLVAQQPGRRARPEGPGAAALGPRDGRSGEQALPAWAPTRGRAPSASKPPDPSESLLSPHGPRAQPPPRDLP